MPCGQGHTKRYVDAHGIVKSIPQKLSDVLPAVHSLTGCNTTSKIQCHKNCNSELLPPSYRVWKK